MSAQKTLSQLSFAIIALFFAAIPCFAQTESVAARSEQLSISASEVAVANNVRRIGAHRSETFSSSEAKATVEQQPFSATKFMQVVNETASLETKSTSAQAVALNFDTTAFESPKPASPKRITFAPSKGHQQIPQ